MRLVTPREAAKAFYVTPAMIGYWLRKGRIQRHYIKGSTWRYLVDLDEIKVASKGMEGMKTSAPTNLITREEAAKLIWVSKESIGYYVRMGYIKRHYVLGNRYHYLVDRDEVLAQVDLIQKRIDDRKPKLRDKAKEQPRVGGKFIKV